MRQQQDAGCKRTRSHKVMCGISVGTLRSALLEMRPRPHPIEAQRYS